MTETDPAPCAAKLKALADATRLAVMEALLDGPRRVGDLVELLGVEQSLMSHHLRVLRDMGLLEARRDGKAVVYALAPEVAAEQGLDLGCCRLSFKDREGAA